MKAIFAAAACVLLTSCTTQQTRTFNDPVMAGMWSRTELFRLESLSAGADERVIVSLKVFDTANGKQLGAPVLTVQPGTSFDLTLDVPPTDNGPVASAPESVSLQGRVDVSSDRLGRRVAGFHITGKDRTGRGHVASGTMRLEQ